jgi:hypothetical protein
LNEATGSAYEEVARVKASGLQEIQQICGTGGKIY